MCISENCFNCKIPVHKCNGGNGSKSAYLVPIATRVGKGKEPIQCGYISVGNSALKKLIRDFNSVRI